MPVRSGVVAALFVALSFTAGPLPAQGRPAAGAMHGVVTDRTSDSAVAGVHLLLVGTPLTSTTNDRGEFSLVGVEPGRYTLRALCVGYAPAVQAGLVVAAGATLEVRLTIDAVALQLAGINVTATGSAQKVGESSVSVAVQDRTDIIAHSAVEVQDALPFVPGVNLNHGEVDIRGASGLAEGVGSRVLMLLDGHPVLTGDGGEIDYEALPILDLDRAEVVKGSQSALYGSAAMGGVVNLITTPIGERPATAMKLHYGLYDQPSAFRYAAGRPDYWGLDLQHSRRAGSVGVRLALGTERSDGYHQNGEFTRWLLRAKVSSMPGSAHPWDVYAIVSDLDQGQFSTWRSPSQPYQVQDSAVGDWNHNVHLLLGGRYAALAGSRGILQIEPSLTFTAVRDHMHDSNNWHDAARSGVNTLLTFNPGSEHAVTVGADVAETELSSSYYGRKWTTDAAPYGQEEWALSSSLRATAGVRVDYHHADGGKAEETVNPKVGVAFNPDGPFAFRASFGRGYRAPSAIEQFVSTAQQGVRVVPNPNLHGETAWSGEFGGAASLGWLWLDGAVFQSWYRGLIGPGPVPGQLFAFSFQNTHRAVVRGVDATAKVSIASRRVDLSLNYMYLDTRDDSTGRPLPYRSRHTVTASVDLLGGLAGVDVRYRSRLEQVLEFPLDPRSDITLVDLRLGFRVKGVVFLAKVSNLLQARYVDVMERNEGAPRSLLVTGMTGL
jgi:outer membrane receptor for ferrienterochelin and colicins